MSKKICFCHALAVAALLSQPAFAQAVPEGDGYGVPTRESNDRDAGMNDRETMAGENDRNNDRQDREDSKPLGITADQQSEKEADRDMTRKIRQAIVKDDTLSMRADNIKIITRDGMVTLRGMVKSDEEKNKIREKAVLIAGADKVTDYLEVENHANNHNNDDR